MPSHSFSPLSPFCEVPREELSTFSQSSSSAVALCCLTSSRYLSSSFSASVRIVHRRPAVFLRKYHPNATPTVRTSIGTRRYLRSSGIAIGHASKRASVLEPIPFGCVRATALQGALLPGTRESSRRRRLEARSSGTAETVSPRTGSC